MPSLSAAAVTQRKSGAVPITIDPEIWTAKDVAQLTKTKINWVYRHAERGDIPSAYQIGKVWRFEPAAVRAWYEELKRPKGRKA